MEQYGYGIQECAAAASILYEFRNKGVEVDMDDRNERCFESKIEK
jgi:hypothetical protein